jgi:hypothetical protein
MKSISDGIFELTGKNATSAEIQKIMAIASAMDIKTNDPLLMLFMVLEHYNSLYKEAPENIKAAVNAASSAAVINANVSVNNAVASLIPSMQKVVNDAAKQTLVKVQIGASMITIYAGIIIIGMVFMLGLMYGSGIESALNKQLITIQQFWLMTATSIASGIAIIGTIILSATWWQDADKIIFAYISSTFASTLGLMMLINILQLLK